MLFITQQVQVRTSSSTSSLAVLKYGTSGDEFDDQSVDINLLMLLVLPIRSLSTWSILTLPVQLQLSTSTAVDCQFKLADSSEVHKVDIDHSGTGGAKLVVTGANIAGDLTIDNLEAGITTIDASGLTGFLNLILVLVALLP